MGTESETDGEDEATSEALYSSAAQQLLRAIRGKRSQIGFARRLGYRANPITDWENGRRSPTAEEALRAALLVKLPVLRAFERFHQAEPPHTSDGSIALAAWLSAIRGSVPLVEVASRTGVSRFTVGRWLSGAGKPKLDEFLRFVDALTGRVHDWVSELVPIEAVPSLKPRHERAHAARRLAFEEPWTEAILRVLETNAYAARPLHCDSELAASLGIDERVVRRCLDRLEEAGIVARNAAAPNAVTRNVGARGHYRVTGNLSVDTRAAPLELGKLKQHWLRVGLERASLERTEQSSPEDWLAYNVISVSHLDLERVRLRLSQAFKEIRAIVAASEPSESAALVNLQLVHWPEPFSQAADQK
jgi:transcriptional regulator with XRE-family HTH domain